MTTKTLRRRLDRLESNRRGNHTVLMLWGNDDDPDIKRQAEMAKREGRQVLVLRWRSDSSERPETSANRS